MPTLDLSGSKNSGKTLLETLSCPDDNGEEYTPIISEPQQFEASPIEKNCLSILKASESVGSEIQLLRYARAALSLQSFARHDVLFGYSSQENNRRFLKYVFKALRKCYEYHLGEENAELVTGLLREIFYSDEDLGVLFSNVRTPTFGQCCGLSLTLGADLLYPDRNNNHRRTLPALEYFLHHIKIDEEDMPTDDESVAHVHQPCKLSTPFQYFLNSPRCFKKSGLPLTMAASAANSDAVLLLLRFGANPFTVSSSNNEDGEHSAFSKLISSLNCLAFAKRACRNDGCNRILQTEEDKILLCLRYIRRAVKMLPVISSNSPDANKGLVKLITGEVTTDYVQTVHKMYWPTFQDEGLLDIPCLQHLCRSTVRCHLSSLKDTVIPVAIGHLPMPGKLKTYLNLYRD